MCAAGADLLNDAWGGFDPALAEVAAEHGAALVCTHTNGATPRTPPHRPSYDDVVAAAIEATVALAERAVSLGVRRDSVLIDPAHDFDKNTWHSLELTRRLDEMVATGWPVLVSLSHKDFVGETLDRAARRAAGRHAGRQRGQRLARRPGVPRPRRRRDPAAARHGRQHPRHPAARPRRPGAGVIAAAVLVPHPPLLLRELGGSHDPVPDLRAAALAAVRDLVRDVDVVVVVGGADVARVLGPGGRRRRPSLRYDVRPPGPARPCRCRSASACGCSPRRGGPGRSRSHAVAWDADRSTLDDLAGALTGHGRTASGCCVLGDGSARRGEKAPGYLDERAFPFDDAVAKALADGDADRARRPRRGPGGRADGAGRRRVPVPRPAGAARRPSRPDATLTFRDDPFGVDYLVATWRF